VALAPDAALRAGSDGRRSLDDVVRALLAAADHAGGVLALDTTGLARAAESEVAGSGAQLTSWARSPEETATLVEPLARLGLQLDIQPASDRADAGFVAEREGNALHVTAVDAEGPAADAGLRTGDRILTLDGAAAPPHWPELLAQKPVGTTIQLEVQRGRRRLQLHLALGPLDDAQVRLTPAAATPRVTRWREAWLGP
jgi:predicted metalloprotease with PDZ domain